jgi:hypothetical protein
MEESNAQPIPENIQVTTITRDVLINVEISGYFLSQLQALLYAMCNEVSEKDLVEFYERLKKNEPSKTSHEEAIALLTALVHDIERLAIEQKKATTREMPAKEAVEILGQLGSSLKFSNNA